MYILVWVNTQQNPCSQLLSSLAPSSSSSSSMYAEMKAIMASSLPNLHLPTYAGRCFFLKLGERHSYPLLPCRVPIRANASFCASLVSPHHTIPLVTEGPTSHLVEQQFSELNLNQLSGKVNMLISSIQTEGFFSFWLALLMSITMFLNCLVKLLLILCIFVCNFWFQGCRGEDKTAC